MSRSRIASVIRVRRLQEQLARTTVAAARRHEAAEAERRAAVIDAVEQVATTASSTAAAFVAQRRLVHAGVRDAMRATEAVATARAGVGVSIEGWIVADRRLDGVERLDERWARTTAVEADRRAWAELDELTIARWSASSPSTPNPTRSTP